MKKKAYEQLKLMTVVKRDILLFVATISFYILFFNMLPYFISSGISFEKITDGLNDAFVFDKPFKFYIGYLILIIGIPAVVLNRLSIFLNKWLNFILLPLASFVLVLGSGLILGVVFNLRGESGSLSWAIIIAFGVLFHLPFSLVVSFFNFFVRHKKHEQKMA